LIKVPRNSPPHQVWVNPTLGRQLLQQGEAIASQRLRLPVHTQLRTTHHRSEAILEVIQERKISLLIMGWKGTKNIFTGRLFGDVTGKIIRSAPCDVVFVKGSRKLPQPAETTTPQRWLIPLCLGQMNIEPLIALLPQLSAFFGTPEYILCTIPPAEGVSKSLQSPNTLEGTIQQFSKQLQAPVQGVSLTSQGIENQVLQVATEKECDVIVLLTSLKRVSRSLTFDASFEHNLPAMIANRFSGTVILVRPAGELSMNNA
jgi:CIC family chloride channel protein